MEDNDNCSYYIFDERCHQELLDDHALLVWHGADLSCANKRYLGVREKHCKFSQFNQIA